MNRILNQIECSECHELLPPGDFYPTSGLHCRRCHIAAVKRARKVNPLLTKARRHRTYLRAKARRLARSREG